MIYILLAVGVVALLVWTGRRARPRLAGREWRAATGGLSALAFVGAAAAGLKGAPLIAVGLGLVGLALAFGVRAGQRKTAVAPPKAGDTEARAILGVGPDATEAEIQAAYTRLMRMAHPDTGGTTGLASQLNAARDQLLGRLR